MRHRERDKAEAYNQEDFAFVSIWSFPKNPVRPLHMASTSVARPRYLCQLSCLHHSNSAETEAGSPAPLPHTRRHLAPCAKSADRATVPIAPCSVLLYQ